MEVSVVIPCMFSEYDSDAVLNLFLKFKDEFDKFEFILVTSIKTPKVCNSCIKLTNKDQRIKTYSAKSNNKEDLTLIGLSHSTYSITLLLDLKRYKENSDVFLSTLSSIGALEFKDRYRVFSSNTKEFLLARTFDFKRILSVVKNFSMLEYLNIFDYLNFKLFIFNKGVVEPKNIDYFTDSPRLTKKLVKKRKSKLYHTEFCDYPIKKMEV